MESKTAVAGLAALAQDARLAVFRLLVQKGPDGLCVGDIAAKFDMAPATLSFHLKELTGAGLLVGGRKGDSSTTRRISGDGRARVLFDGELLRRG